MDIAIDFAWKFQLLTLPNPAVGACVVSDDKIIALQGHIKAGNPHAEILALKEAFLYFLKNSKKKRNKILKSIIKYGIKKGFLLQKGEYYIESKLPQSFKDIESNLDSMESSADFSADSSVKIANNDMKHLKKIESKNEILNKLINYLEKLENSQDIHKFISKFHNNIFKKCKMYITLEPCNHFGKTPPCSKLLKKIKIKSLCVGIKDSNSKAAGGFETLKNIDIKKNISAENARNLIYPFTQMQKNNAFLVFKIAHRLNGEYKNGIISNLDSKIYSHNMRSIADFIIISGETLRNDNPLLDTRYAIFPYQDSKLQDSTTQDSIKNSIKDSIKDSGAQDSNIKDSIKDSKVNNAPKLPKIYIFSKNIKSIESYNINGREVSIIDSIDKIPNVGFGIIEGGFNFLASLLNEYKKDSVNNAKIKKIDCILGYIAPNFSQDSMQQDSTKLDSTTQDSIKQDSTNKNCPNIESNKVNEVLLQDFYLAKTDVLNNFWQDFRAKDSKHKKLKNIESNDDINSKISNNSKNIIYYLFRKM